MAGLVAAVALMAHGFLLPFRVGSDALWSVHSVKSPTKLERLLPSGLTLAKVRVLKTDTLPRACICINTFRVHTPLFRGTRAELVTLARSRNGGLHFVVIDCLSDTFSWMPGQGVRGATTDFAPAKWRVANCVRVRASSGARVQYALSGRVGSAVGLTREFAIEANELCYTASNARPIQLLFSPATVGADVMRMRSIECICAHPEWAGLVGPVRSAFLHPHPMLFVVVLPLAFFASMFTKPDALAASQTDSSGA